MPATHDLRPTHPTPTRKLLRWSAVLLLAAITGLQATLHEPSRAPDAPTVQQARPAAFIEDWRGNSARIVPATP